MGHLLDPGLLWAALGFFLGGILKGATGAGAPIIAVPLLALFYDVPFAVSVFALPSLVSNLWQAIAYRREMLEPRVTWPLALGAAAGAVAGTVILVTLPLGALSLTMALVIFAYIAFRLARPGWVLPMAAARRLAAPAGFAAGILQGASGISAPVSITFLNALRPERLAFMATISILFSSMSLVQLPSLALAGVLTPQKLAISLAALVPLAAGMPVGAWLARRVSRAAFDRVILVMLAVVALRLVWSVLGA